MVETDTGSGHTAGKRRQRSDLRNPEVRRMVRDGELSISSKFKRVRETRSFNAHFFVTLKMIGLILKVFSSTIDQKELRVGEQ